MSKSSRRTLVLLLLVMVLIWMQGPGASTRERARADAVTLTSDAVTAHPEPVQEPASGSGELVVNLVDGADEATRDRIGALLGVELSWVHPHAVDEALASAHVDDLAVAIETLANVSEVEVAEPSIEVEALGWPDDPRFGEQWNLRRVDAEAGWWRTPAGAGVVVAVIDTGVSAVEDLESVRILEGASFVPGAADARDDNGHGTHVAGTIAQTTNNGLGVASVAPYATILPIKVLSGYGSGTSEQVAAGIDHAVDLGADVINLSLGSGRYSAVIHTAVRKARAAGVLVVAAAGNDGRTGVSWPGALREAIGVAAVGPDGSRAPYSNRGKGVDIAAPGGDKRVEGGGILQDTIDGSGGHAYREFQGTSMATPHVAGAAAVLLSTGVLSPSAVERLLLSGASSDRWGADLGWGELDLGASLDLIGGAQPRVRLGLGMVMGLLLSALAGAGLGMRMGVAVLAGWVAGGLPVAGVWPGVAPALASYGLLAWPSVLVGPTWGALFAWVAFVVPLAAAFVWGASRATRPLALGLCAGVAAHLLHGLVHGTWAMAWVPGSVTTSWFGLQVLISTLAAMAVAGAHRLDGRRER